MIITRTGEAVEFKLSETRRVAIDTSHVASAAQVVERAAGGRLLNALLLITDQDEMPVRIEANAAEIAVMHARLAEVMSETRGPALPRNTRSDRLEQTIN